MSPVAAYSEPSPTLTAQRGGLCPAPVKMHPSEIALGLTKEILRLPITMNARAVLAEIVSLHAANAGCCDASDAHFAARLTLNKDTVSVAVKLLEAEGLIRKVTIRQPTGFYRTLTPNPAAIAAKAATNPYPEIPASPTRKFRVAPTEKPEILPGISGHPYPEIPATPTRKFRAALPGNSGSNTPLNLPGKFQETPTPSAGAGEQKKIGPEPALDLPHLSADDSGNSPPRCAPPPENAHFAALWETWPKKEKRPAALAAFAQLSEADQQAAASRADTWLSARPHQQREAGRYLPQLVNWLSDHWADTNPSPAPAQPHVTHPTSYPPRPVNGHKPLGNGGALARALAEQRRPK